jgi:hypothetical protein
MLSTRNRTQVLPGRRTIETGLTLSVTQDNSRRLPTREPFGLEGNSALTPVKDMFFSVPMRSDVSVLSRQTDPPGTRSIRRRSQVKDCQGTVRA